MFRALGLSATILAAVVATGQLHASEYREILAMKTAVGKIGAATTIDESYAAVEALGLGYAASVRVVAGSEAHQSKGTVRRVNIADALAQYPELSGPLEATAASEVDVISAGTTVVLRAGERLELKMPLLVAGVLRSDSGAIFSDASTSAILIGNGGRVELFGTTVSGLGDQLHPSLVAVGSGTAIVHDSLFRTSGAVTVLGAGGFEVARTIFDHPPGTAIAVDGGSQGALHGNLVNAAGGDAFVVRSSSGALEITSNILISGAGAGIRVDSTTGMSLLGNFVAANKGPALALVGTTCMRVKGNWLVANNDGVAINNSFGAEIANNLVAFNDRAGIRVSNQPLMAALTLTNNEIKGNRVGLTGSDPTPIRLAANVLSGQSPRIFGGAYGSFSGDYLKATGGTFTLAADIADAAALSLCPSDEGF